MLLAAIDVAGDLEQVGVGLMVAFLLGVVAAAVRLSRRLSNQDRDIAYIKDTLDRQFGTNGFVLKSEVRDLKAGRELDRQRLDEHLAFHATDHNL